MTTYLIQPHPDDLAYSLGGALIMDSFGPNVEAITVFSLSKSSKKPLEHITNTRRNEDREFFKKVGIKFKDFGLPDSSIRNLYDTSNTLRTVIDMMCENICLGDTVICPLAIGYHIDHLIVKEAVKSLKDWVRVIFYEDIPYVFRYGNPMNGKMKKYKMSLNGSTMKKKIENLKIYDSQMDDVILEQVRNKREEVLWS